MDNLGVHLRHFYLGSRVTGAVWPLLTAPYKNTYLLYLLTINYFDYGEDGDWAYSASFASHLKTMQDVAIVNMCILNTFNSPTGISKKQT